MKRDGLRRALVFAGAACITSVFFINFCNLVFRCGCESLWAAAAELCNIHKAGSRHCPWCALGTSGYALVYGTMIGSQAVLSFGFPRLDLPARIALAVSAFPVSGAILALIMGVTQGYWA